MGGTRALSDDEIFSRIDVLPPYYALRDVEVDDLGDVTATVRIEQPLGAEIGPVSGAEAGRHLAIIGSLAAAAEHTADGRHHYLATDAEIRRAKKVPEDASELVLRAHGSILDKRTAHAMVTAETEHGKRVCTLSCYYAIVEYDTMRFFFADHVQETPPSTVNPFVELIEPAQVDIAGGHIEVDLGAVDAASCAGHFDGLPAMPVAYLMSNVAAAAGRLLRKRSSDDDLRFSIAEASVRADGLAFAGEQVRLTASTRAPGTATNGSTWRRSPPMTSESARCISSCRPCPPRSTRVRHQRKQDDMTTPSRSGESVGFLCQLRRRFLGRNDR